MHGTFGAIFPLILRLIRLGFITVQTQYPFQPYHFLKPAF